MNKRITIALLIGIIVVVLAFFIVIQPFYQPQKAALSEVQIVACNAAEKGNTCFTKLRELDLISPETCCKELNLCCQ